MCVCRCFKCRSVDNVDMPPDLTVALPQPRDGLALRLQRELRHASPQAVVVHGRAVLVNWDLGRDRSDIWKKF